MMKKLYGGSLVSIIFLMSAPTTASPQNSGEQMLRLVQTISMPNVEGRLDHMDVDVKGKRLFVAGLENGTLEVVDLQSGKWIRSLRAFRKPQGALYVEELNELFVASGDDAMLRFSTGTHWIFSTPSSLRVVYEPHSQLVYVGYGGKDAGKDWFTNPSTKNFDLTYCQRTFSQCSAAALAGTTALRGFEFAVTGSVLPNPSQFFRQGCVRTTWMLGERTA